MMIVAVNSTATEHFCRTKAIANAPVVSNFSLMEHAKRYSGVSKKGSWTTAELLGDIGVAMSMIQNTKKSAEEGRESHVKWKTLPSTDAKDVVLTSTKGVFE